MQRLQGLLFREDNMRKPIVSITIKDCVVETFRGSGPGGQNKNKRDSCVRIKHPPSGAVGEGRDARTQFQNKQSAFKRMAESKEFKNWLKIQAARLVGFDPEAEVEKALAPKNLKIEVKDENGNWVIPHLHNEN